MRLSRASRAWAVPSAAVPRARLTRVLFVLLVAAATAVWAAIASGCTSDGDPPGVGGDDAGAAADDGSPTTDGNSTNTDSGGDCASVEIDGDRFTLGSADGEVVVAGTAPRGYEPAEVADPCEVAVVELLAPIGASGELATLGFTLDLGPLLRDSITELANEAIGLLVGENDEVLVDDRVTVADRPARRVEIALAGTADAPGGRGLLVFIEAGGDQVATLTVVGRVDDYEIAADDVAAVLDSLEITPG